LIIGSAMPFCAGSVYIASILRGKTKPQRMTRFLMVVMTALSFAALLAGHDHSGVWIAGASLLQGVPIWVLSFRYGIGGRSRLDVVCLLCCGAGLALWALSGQSLFGLLMSIVADFIGCIPSLHKTVRLPHTESWLFYAIDTVASLLVVCAAGPSLKAALYPAYLFLVNLAFVGIICWPGRTLAAARARVPSDQVSP